jgi:hypothetical protein
MNFTASQTLINVIVTLVKLAKMNLCCQTYIDLGCLSACPDIDTGLIATQSGDYEIFIQFNNAIDKLIVPLTATDPIVISTELNENYIYKIKIFAPDDSEVGCYRFTTKFINTI